MRKHLGYIVLVSHLIVCFGCNGQQKGKTIKNTNIHNQDSMSINVDKSNLKKEDILSLDYDMALAILGEPISRKSFPATEISKFSVGVRRYLPADTVLQIRELTFEVKADTNLTIWYQEKGKKWQPIHFMRWNKNMQF